MGSRGRRMGKGHAIMSRKSEQRCVPLPSITSHHILFTPLPLSLSVDASQVARALCSEGVGWYREQLHCACRSRLGAGLRINEGTICTIISSACHDSVVLLVASAVPLRPGGWLASTGPMNHCTHDAALWGKPQEMGVLG